MLSSAAGRAGQRGLVAVALAQDLPGLNDFLREFRASGNSDAEAYPEGDGIRLGPAEGYLTLGAAKRALPAMKMDQIRDQLNHLLLPGLAALTWRFGWLWTHHGRADGQRRTAVTFPQFKAYVMG